MDRRQRLGTKYPELHAQIAKWKRSHRRRFQFHSRGATQLSAGSAARRFLAGNLEQRLRVLWRRRLWKPWRSGYTESSDSRTGVFAEFNRPAAGRRVLQERGVAVAALMTADDLAVPTSWAVTDRPYRV